MHLVCATEHLLRATRAVARLHQEKRDANPAHTLLIASAPRSQEPGELVVVGWTSQMRAGLFASIPARIERPGQVSVSAPRLADYLATLSAGELQLTQETPPDLEAKPIDATKQPALPPLQITCAWTSERGTESSQRAHFHLYPPTTPFIPPVSAWQSAGVAVATLAARAWRVALSPCTHLAQSRDGKERGVLMRFDAEGLLFTATSPFDLATSRLAVPCAQVFAHSYAALFDASDLAWISKILQDDEQIHLRLVREEQQAILLVSTANGTLFCKGSTTELPLSWEQPPRYPSEAHLVVERLAFSQALELLATALGDEETAPVGLRTEAHQLVARLIDAPDDLAQIQTEILVVEATAPLPEIQMDLCRIRRLVRALQGKRVCLEWGSFVQQLPDRRQIVGFLRLVSDPTGTTFVLARSDAPDETEMTHVPMDAEKPSALVPANPTELPTPSQQAEAQEPVSPLTHPAAEAREPIPLLPTTTHALLRKELYPMSPLPSLLVHRQADDALSQLGLYYHRQFLQVSLPRESREACAWLRDQLLSADSQQAVWEQIRAQAERDWSAPDAAFWIPLCNQAAGLLQQVMDAGGSIHPLVAGITDGFRHFCLRCGQDAEKREEVRFFQERDCRWLLTTEVGNTPRSVYDRCQSCLQPLAPNQVVVFVPAGTVKHVSGCTCQQCNQRSLASVLNIYACDPQMRQIMLPRLVQVAAPSRQQCMERAVALCWREGWYMASEEPRAHALSPLALTPTPEENKLPVNEPIA